MEVAWNIDLKRRPTSEQNIVDSIKLNQILSFETNIRTGIPILQQEAWHKNNQCDYLFTLLDKPCSLDI